MCARVRDPSLLPPLPPPPPSFQPTIWTRGTSEIDTNCRSSLGRHLQTILTRIYILLLILQLAIFVSVDCLFTPFCLHCFIVHTLRFGLGRLWQIHWCQQASYSLPICPHCEICRIAGSCGFVGATSVSDSKYLGFESRYWRQLSWVVFLLSALL